MAQWVATQTPEALAAYAIRGQDMAGVLMGTIPALKSVGPALVRRLVGDAAVARMRAMGPADFDRLLADVAARCPAQGMVLFLYADWFRAQLSSIRDRIVGG